ncbi:MAG: hypothetical protein M1818_006316 [Claussenomyces sp. TS43310]|nr:MAG: hypothetical protein M1818_006316 [Claussenomyces sp. TS43310]
MAELATPPNEPSAILEEEAHLVFPDFNADVAWELGSTLRQRLRDLTPLPASISISLANSNRVLFQAVSRPGAVPDNEVWVLRKRATVLRWGHSTWYFSRKFDSDEQLFAAKNGLSPEAAARYAIHGGAVPVFVAGVEGVVGVVVVSGLKQAQDHQVVVEAMRVYLQKVYTDGGRRV